MIIFTGSSRISLDADTIDTIEFGTAKKILDEKNLKHNGISPEQEIIVFYFEGGSFFIIEIYDTIELNCNQWVNDEGGQNATKNTGN